MEGKEITNPIENWTDCDYQKLSDEIGVTKTLLKKLAPIIVEEATKKKTTYGESFNKEELMLEIQRSIFTIMMQAVKDQISKSMDSRESFAMTTREVRFYDLLHIIGDSRRSLYTTEVVE